MAQLYNLPGLSSVFDGSSHQRRLSLKPDEWSWPLVTQIEGSLETWREICHLQMPFRNTHSGFQEQRHLFLTDYQTDLKTDLKSRADPHLPDAVMRKFAPSDEPTKLKGAKRWYKGCIYDAGRSGWIFSKHHHTATIHAGLLLDIDRHRYTPPPHGHIESCTSISELNERLLECDLTLCSSHSPGSMIIFLIFLLPMLASIPSAGIPVVSRQQDDNDEGPVFLTTYRSTIQIIWACLTIVFASTWVCIHPHVYGYKSTPLQRIGRRLRLFSNALLFPDRFVQRAFEQWMGYRKLYKDMRKKATKLGIPLVLPSKESLWTPVHAHFIQMGGVIFRSSRGGMESVESLSRRQGSDTGSVTPEETLGDGDDQERRGSADLQDSEKATLNPGAGRGGDDTNKDSVRWYKDFREWDDNDIRDYFKLQLTEAQIEDRSKADGLAKAFVIIQCLWFVVQCIGRAVYGLPVLELEVACLAFIACNIGMYCFWWKKPMNVVCPAEIHQRSKEHNDAMGGLRKGTAGILNWIRAVVWTLKTGDVGHLANPMEQYYEFKTIEPTSTLYPENYLYSRTGTTDEGALLEEWGFWPWAAYAIAPALFGALHSIGWYSSFPSATEQLLWRASCVIPVAHALIFIFCVLGEGFSKSVASSWPRIARRAFRATAAWIAGLVHILISTPLNLAARFVFIVLPPLQLRNLPSLAHQTVPWSDFLPHV
ncbi:hypothetical protein NMY22_g5173 [Coprinellus aureogranulatus]|nr:hypothetical protein NMY22_g5173 [Coprinellus aureogranulatus]